MNNTRRAKEGELPGANDPQVIELAEGLSWRQRYRACLIASLPEAKTVGKLWKAPVDWDIKRLCALLLSYGGKSVEIYRDPTIAYVELLAVGQFLGARKVIFQQGRRRDHRVGNLLIKRWERGHKRLMLVPGFALSKDGSWHPHNWLSGKLGIVDVARTHCAYWGWPQTFDETQRGRILTCKSGRDPFQN